MARPPTYTLKDLQDRAKIKGGKCLSTKYPGSKKVKYQCAEGHTWSAVPYSIINRGNWCPYCSGKASLTIADARAYAIEHGGKCLSSRYSYERELEWECSEGHRWKERFNDLKQSGRFCSFCLGTKIYVDTLIEIAESKGGQYLGYSKNQRGVGRFVCSKGHHFIEKAALIKAGCWCSKCYSERAWTLARMQSLAKERGGKCLSKECVGSRGKYEWECDKGHVWKTKLDVIVMGSWCPRCAGHAITIEDMQVLAEKRGGKCLSPKYLGGKTPLEWECREGHRWMTRPENIKYDNTWCPECVRINRKKFTMIDLDVIAKEKGGRCLSEEYIDTYEFYKWECRNGHVWQETILGAHRTWCEECKQISNKKGVLFHSLDF